MRDLEPSEGMAKYIQALQFNISIMDFATDIRQSAIRPDGYLKKLEHCPDLQTMYKKAINQIYGESTQSVTS
jgi:hypothetical protein